MSSGSDFLGDQRASESAELPRVHMPLQEACAANTGRLEAAGAGRSATEQPRSKAGGLLQQTRTLCVLSASAVSCMSNELKDPIRCAVQDFLDSLLVSFLRIGTILMQDTKDEERAVKQVLATLSIELRAHDEAVTAFREVGAAGSLRT